MDLSKARKGLTDPLESIRYRLDAEQILEDLGIEPSHEIKGWIMASCPNFTGAHDNGDSNPSFGLNRELLKYNCFMCGGGDVIHLVQNVVGCDKDAAIKWLEERANLDPTNKDLKDAVLRLMSANTVSSSAWLPDYPTDSLFQYRRIHPYLLERGITREVIIEHQVGYDDEHMAIVIPHFFLHRLVGIQYRHLVETNPGVYWCPKESCADKKGRVPKYKNTSDFPKLNTIFNWDDVWLQFRQRSDRKPDRPLIVESPMTVMWLKSYGYRNVLGTFGAFSQEQASLLRHFYCGVLYWPDNDSAGRTNLKRFIEWLRYDVPLGIIPMVSGAKSDAANLHPHDIDAYLAAEYSPLLYARRGPLTIEDRYKE